MNKVYFDNDKYIKMQSEKILERIEKFDNKLYLEFGGKLFDDAHASRVLPGFKEDSKLKMLLQLKDKAEVIIAVNAQDIESNKVRADLQIGYDSETLRLIDSLTSVGLYVSSVVINRFNNQPAALNFRDYLNSMGIKTYLSYTIEGYPNNTSHIVSDQGYGKNDYVETSRPLVVVTAPGPGSGKLSTCLSQMYHEYKNGVRAGYAKFETFPVWNLPLRHPVNLAYEAATADLNDINMIDPFHLEAYGQTTINYNRDIEAFPILVSMFKKIMGNCPYESPTDMGVNMVGYCISDDDGVRQASKDEIIRRYFDALCNYKLGKIDIQVVEKIDILMSQLDLEMDDRIVSLAAKEKADSSNQPSFAIELENGDIIKGRKTDLLSAPSAAVLNTLKELGGINDEIHLISPHILTPILDLKTKLLNEENPILNLDEVLIALAMSATTNPLSLKANEQVTKLKGLQAHSSVILSSEDKKALRKLNLIFTASPEFASQGLYKNY